MRRNFNISDISEIFYGHHAVTVVELHIRRRYNMNKLDVLIMALCMICIVAANIIYYMIRFVKLVTCRGIEECRNRNCIFNESCSKYDSRLTEEEANELYKLIDDKCEKK